MKTVFFIRHAKSSWADSMMADIDRPLNKRGLRDAPFMAQLLKGKGATIDKIVSSPAKRAFTTATYFAEQFGQSENDILVRREIYDAWPEDIVGVVQSLDNNWNNILVFGHNPGFTSVANLFANEYIPNLPTCGIVEVSADISEWNQFNQTAGRFKSFYFPKQYFE